MESDEREDAMRGYRRLGIDEHHDAGGEPGGSEKSADPRDPFAEDGVGAQCQAEEDDVGGHDQQTGQHQRVDDALLGLDQFGLGDVNQQVAKCVRIEHAGVVDDDEGHS